MKMQITLRLPRIIDHHGIAIVQKCPLPQAFSNTHQYTTTPFFSHSWKEIMGSWKCETHRKFYMIKACTFPKYLRKWCGTSIVRSFGILYIILHELCTVDSGISFSMSLQHWINIRRKWNFKMATPGMLMQLPRAKPYQWTDSTVGPKV